MKYLIGVSAYYEIELDKELENDSTEKIAEAFWELYHKNMLSEPELDEIFYIDKIK